MIRDSALRGERPVVASHRGPTGSTAAARRGVRVHPGKKDWIASEGGRPLPSHDLYAFVEVEPVSVPDDVRRATSNGHVHAPHSLEHTAPGADARERSDDSRDRRGTRSPADGRRCVGRRSHPARVRARARARTERERGRDREASPREPTPATSGRAGDAPASVEQSAWAAVARVLFNLAEFSHRS